MPGLNLLTVLELPPGKRIMVARFPVTLNTLFWIISKSLKKASVEL